MPFYSTNGGLIGPGTISTRTGVHDLDRARLTPFASSSTVIPVTNLYSHWDLSKLSDPVGTIYSNTFGTVLTGSSGLNIGASATTPALEYRFNTSQQTCQINATASGRKYISFTAGGNTGVGSYIQSAGNAYPNITTAGYTWIAVWAFTSNTSGYTRPYRWYLNNYMYDFNHGDFFAQPSGGGQLDILNYSNSGVFQAGPAALSLRGTAATTIMIDTITVVNNIVKYNCYVNAINYTGTLNFSVPTYSTQPDVNRYLQIFDHIYTTVRPSAKYYELAFYSAPLTDADAAAATSALYTKWTT